MLFARVSALRDAVLLSGTKQLLRTEAAATAELLARLAVIQQRRLFAAAGYPSMYEYCVRELGLSEDAALRRLNASRLAAAQPALFDALADRRLSLSVLLMLSPYMGAARADELIVGLAHKSLAEAREWLACRFPQPMLETRVEFVSPDGERRLIERGTTLEQIWTDSMGQVALTRPVLSNQSAISEVMVPLPRAQVRPLSSEYVAYQFSARRGTHELMLRAQALLGHEVPHGDIEAVFARGLEVLVRELEKKKHGLHTQTRATSGDDVGVRYIPARARAEVFARDGGQCAFVTGDGKRCECREALEYDHITPVAHGGRGTPDNLRLLCRAHNQLEADRKLGSGFMDAKRGAAEPLVNHQRARTPGERYDGEADVRAALFTLGFRKDEVPSALEFAAGLPHDTSAPERVKAILRGRGVRRSVQLPEPSPAEPSRP